MSLISELHAQFSRVHNTVYAAMAASDGAEVLVTSVGVMFDQAPDLVDTFCRACEERVRWQEGTAYDEQSQSEAEEIEIYYVKTREKVGHHRLMSSPALAGQDRSQALLTQQHPLPSFTTF